MNDKLPLKAYGVLERNVPQSSIEKAVEQLSILGYVIIDSGYSSDKLNDLSILFDSTHLSYIDTYGVERLKKLNEFYTIRAPLTHTKDGFLSLALNENVIAVLKNSINGKFILNQQNGLINPPKDKYTQATWHRDLPYQHFVSSSSLSISALFCLDNFTFENGATYVLPASNKIQNFPSEWYVKENAIQLEAKAGSFIIFDSMLYHAGGFNQSSFPRRAVNHIYSIPQFKQQINIPKNMMSADLTADQKDILGFNFMEPISVADYLLGRNPK
jgi:hypothetical protein